MVNIINTDNNQYNHLTYGTFNGQKLEQQSKDALPRLVVGKKDNVSSAREEIPREQVEQTLEKLNRLMGLIDKRMEFKIHDETNRVMVKIIDQDNGEILSEIPPEKTLDLLSSIQDVVGLIVDEKV
ncbi:MAG: flagellar protein FlaG [Bacillota bacterium]|jgi:flagellar protein FlaG